MYENYKKILEEKGIKTSDVARGIGVSNAILSDWKNGKTTPKTDTIKKIADYLGVSVDYLMTGKENPFSIEMAAIDVELTNMPLEVKEYALKLVALPQEKQRQIMNLIDMLEG